MNTASLTDKQKIALVGVLDNSEVSIKASGGLKELGLISTNGRSRPGYLSATITDAGRAVLATQS